MYRTLLIAAVALISVNASAQSMDSLWGAPSSSTLPAPTTPSMPSSTMPSSTFGSSTSTYGMGSSMGSTFGTTPTDTGVTCPKNMPVYDPVNKVCKENSVIPKSEEEEEDEADRKASKKAEKIAGAVSAISSIFGGLKSKKSEE